MYKIAFLFSVISLNAFSQLGGLTVFNAFNLPTSARSAALGTNFISVKDNDVNLGMANPSLYNTQMNKKISFSQALQAGKFTYNTLQYGRSMKNNFFVAGNLRMASYGKMDQTDVLGNTTGSIHPTDLIIGIGASKTINPVLTVGANLNYIQARNAGYYADGLSMDLAGSFNFETSGTLITALVKNAGFQISKYGANKTSEKENLPTELQIGVSHKLKHAPLRFSFTGQQLQRWDISYHDPNLVPTVDAITGDTIPVKYAGFGEKLFRHTIIATEILVNKNLHLRVAFDYNRRKNFKVDARGSIAGFSFGVGYTFRRFTLDYGLIAYSVAGYNNMITLSINLDKWRNKIVSEPKPAITVPAPVSVPVL
jgi:hypothetical protein